jgi:hypothetical protein
MGLHSMTTQKIITNKTCILVLDNYLLSHSDKILQKMYALSGLQNHHTTRVVQGVNQPLATSDLQEDVAFQREGFASGGGVVLIMRFRRFCH